MGVSGVELAQYQFAADNNGSETLTNVTLVNSTSSTAVATSTDHSTFWNYRLTDTGGNTLGTAVDNGGVLTFSLNGSGLPIASNNTAYVNLVADTNSYPTAVSGATHAFALTGFQYTNASGNTNGTSTAIGKLFTVYQAALSISAGSFQAPASISGAGTTVGSFNFGIGSATKSVTLDSITMFANGSLIGASTTQVLQLFDGTTPLATTSASGTGQFTFNLTTPTNFNEQVGPNSTKTLTVQEVNSPLLLNTVTSGSGTYQLVLKTLTWNDGATTSTITGFSPSLGTQITGQVISGLSN
jgi:hypothetical protein